MDPTPSDAPRRASAPATGPTAGPVVVAVGGGHGLSASLRAIRRYASSVTAVVSVADDGGSSGILREAMPELPAPGDVRKCLGALAEEGSPFARILEHRFAEGTLQGHALGNLLLVALALETGSFADAVDELADRVGAVGRVLPATEEPVALEGVVVEPGGAADQIATVQGQVAVQNSRGLIEIRLRPERPASPAAVASAIAAADQVVIGPGSLFTSVLAAAVVPDVRAAVAATAAQRVFVANLGPQVPETQGFTVADEVDALRRHGIEVDVVLVDPARSVDHLPGGMERVEAPVGDATGRAHDPELLGAALASLISRR